MTLVDRLRARLAGGMADTLLGHDVPDTPGDAEVPAAVLVAIVDRPAPGVLLTRRTDTLRLHAGQVAFPGGRIDPGDAGPVAAALREAEEEIGLPPSRVAVAGIAGRYRTITGYAVTLVVGVVPPGLPLVPREAEVAALFEAPLAYVLDPANRIERLGVDDRGIERRYLEIMWKGHRIWGATAAMLAALGRQLGDD